MVYVLNNLGQPLMPTNRYAKVRILLKSKKARVVNTKPFTIQLLFNTTEYTQFINLGIDSGYLNIGFSAVTDKKELISGEVKLLKDMSERLKKKLCIVDKEEADYVIESLVLTTEGGLLSG